MSFHVSVNETVTQINSRSSFAFDYFFMLIFEKDLIHLLIRFLDPPFYQQKQDAHN